MVPHEYLARIIENFESFIEQGYFSTQPNASKLLSQQNRYLSFVISSSPHHWIRIGLVLGLILDSQCIDRNALSLELLNSELEEVRKVVVLTK